jgi:hypothetical protein
MQRVWSGRSWGYKTGAMRVSEKIPLLGNRVNSGTLTLAFSRREHLGVVRRDTDAIIICYVL